jgi:tetratricopeptide (TPR) repeat protein
MRLRPILWALVGAATLGCAPSASAPASTPPATAPELAPVAATCTHQPTVEEVAGAKGAHRAATRYFDRGDWDSAIRCWKDAYELDCTAHDLLLNIASALEKKGDVASSRAQLDVYLRQAPPNARGNERARRLREALAVSPTR